MGALRFNSSATITARSLRHLQLRHSTASLRLAALAAHERKYSSRIPAGRPSRVKRVPHVPVKLATVAATSASTPPPAPGAKEATQAAAPAKDGSLEMPDALTRELTAPVKVPDDKGGVLQESTHQGVAQILSNSAVVVTRQVEMMNIFLGFEQANKYALLSPDGRPLGYLLEQEGSFGSAISRQMLRNHRPFNALVLSPDGTPLLRVHRALTWINSTTQIWALDPNVQASSGLPGEAAAQVNEQGQQLIGEVRQRWHPLRRRYEIFRSRDHGENMEQVAGVDGAFLTWDFNLQDENGQTIGAINRNFRGFAREIFADVGQYVVRFDAALDIPSEEVVKVNAESKELIPSRGLTLDERAVTLALAFSLDVDYFSRHSSGGGGPGMMPWLFFPGSGGGSAEPAPAPGQGQDSTGVQAPPDAAGGLGQNPAADAGAMAGYDAWSSRRDDDDSSSPPSPPEAGGDTQAGGGASDGWGWQGDSAPGGAPQETWGGYSGAGEAPSQAEDVWGSQGADPWSEAASGAGEGGGGFLSGLWDLLPNGD